MGSKHFFSESGYVAYQIKGNELYNTMLAINFPDPWNKVKGQYIACLLQPGDKTMFKKIDHEPDGGHIVKSYKICFFFMLTRWIS